MVECRLNRLLILHKMIKTGFFMAIERCAWVNNDGLYQQYHDEVWGRAVFDSQTLFAKLCLDGQQAGLSWITILKKQANYEAAFFDFQPRLISEMCQDDVDRLMHNPGIVRNRLKIHSIIYNAKAFMALEDKGINFSEFLWQFTGCQTRYNHWPTKEAVPVSTTESDAMAKALKKRGFSFVGSKICYAFMQAVGMVNDHTQNCFCYQQRSEG
jgi:DNA-3-methyladenine glycosylase I